MNNSLRQKITLLICVSMQAVAVSVLLTVPLVAQDTPVGPAGNSGCHGANASGGHKHR
jgi:hypothetical protein